MDYEKYERDCEKIRVVNAGLLQEFYDWLKEKWLAKKTIKKHINNTSFYINSFLLYSDATEAKDGALGIWMFLWYWFIKKALRASVSSIKKNATSLKKFYTFMFETGRIEKEQLDMLKETIKDEMPERIATMRRYDDESITDMNEVWWL